jgi:cytochrome c biogenesis protein CcdA
LLRFDLGRAIRPLTVSLLTRGVEMRVFKSLAYVAAGIVLGWAAATLLVSTCAAVVGEPRDLGLTVLIGVVTIVGGAGAGGIGAFLLSRFPRLKRGPDSSPTAEGDARSKFMPSTDTAADDAGVQPDKRNVKLGDS